MRWILVGIIAVCNTLGDVLNTAGMKRQGEVEDLSPWTLLRMIKKIVRNPLVLGGFAALAISFFALLSLPCAYVLLTEGGYQGRGRRGARPIVFHVLQKNSNGRPAFHRIGSATFHTHFIRIRNFPWCALSFELYSMLIRRYSKPGELVAHVFSGSGNGAIAALALGRKPVLIDLHYHHLVAKRLRCAVARTRYPHSKFSLSKRVT